MDKTKEESEKNFLLIEDKLRNSFQAIKKDISELSEKMNNMNKMPNSEVEKLKKEIQFLSKKNFKELNEKKKNSYEDSDISKEKKILEKKLNKIEHNKKILKLSGKIGEWKLRYKIKKENEKIFAKRENELEKKQQEFERNLIAKTNEVAKIYENILRNNEKVFEIIRKNNIEDFETLKDKLEKINEKDRQIFNDLNKKNLEIAKKENNLKIKKMNFTEYKNQLNSKESFIKERKFFFTLLFSGILVLSIFGFFKNPADFPGLGKRVFLALILISAVILLYYLKVFELLKEKFFLEKTDAENLRPVYEKNFKDKNNPQPKKSFVEKMVNKLAD